MANKEKQSKSLVDLSHLRKWNLIFASLLVVQALLVIVFGGPETAPITTQYVATDILASEAAGSEVRSVAIRHLGDMQLSWIVAKFLLIFGLVFLALATIWRSRYTEWVSQGINRLRGLVFGIGSGIIVTTVAMISGVSDVAFLALIFGYVLATSLIGFGIGRSYGKLKNILLVCAAGLPGIVFIASGLGSMFYGGNLSSNIYYIYASLFLFFVAISLAIFMRLSGKGRWSDAVYAERMFMIVGFLMPTVLAWQIFVGAL